MMVDTGTAPAPALQPLPELLREPAPERPQLLVDYLQRLGVMGGAPSHALLERLMQRHLAAFPFASVGVRLGNELPLDLPQLFERLVVRQRGGYCFEQNRLLQEMLDELGLDALTWYRYLAEYGALAPEQLRRLRKLEVENQRLRRAVSELMLDKLALEEAAWSRVDAGSAV